MELKETIKGRRSIRKFSSKNVSRETIAEIINVARYAPSAGNTQNWMTIVVTDEEKRKAIATACLEQNWMNTAPVLLVICNKFKKVVNLYGKLGKMFSIQDCAVFATNIMLLSVEKKLGTCWVGAFDNEAISRILDIPENADPEIILALGHPLDSPKGVGMRESIQDLVFFEKWGSRKAKDKKKSIVKEIAETPAKVKEVSSKISSLPSSVIDFIKKKKS